MSSYDFLAGTIVLEVAQLGPDALGGFLADMGATVIKVETPGEGDPIRYAGLQAMGDPEGFGFMHMRWNRGKQSIAIDLKSPEGKALFLKLAAKAHVMVEGMRAGVMDRLGLGYDELRKVNPKLIFCTLSGMGATGPYAAMASHGPSFDAFAGLATVNEGDEISKWQKPQPPAVGMFAMGLYAALGILSALRRADRTGQGAVIEVAAAECAANWLPESVDTVLNKDISHDRPGSADRKGRMIKWSRMDNYRCLDGKLIYIMILYEKYWLKFLKIMGREDMLSIYDRSASPEEADEAVAAFLAETFATRTRTDWLAYLKPYDVPAMPVNSFEDLVADPHFAARDNTYAVRHPEAGEIRLAGTPVRTPDQAFAPPLAPLLGQHTDQILKDVVGLSADEAKALKASGSVA